MNPELLYKYLENKVSEQEMQQVLDWLDADPAHRHELDQLDRVFCASVIYGKQPEQQPVKKPMHIRRIVRYTIDIAAVLVVGFVISLVLMNYRIGEWSKRTTALEIPTGHYLSMTLEDGSTVWLNSGTRLEYPLVFAGKERRVKLSGEAMFDVQHDPEHPFVVETYACDVEVLGTRFDVVADQAANLFSTALLRGHVKVTNRANPNDYCLLYENESVQLVDGHLSRNTIQNPDEYLWTEGLISIKGVAFDELMRKFERCYGVTITIRRHDLPAINYNHGKIRISDGIDSALRLLQLASDFTYVKNDETNTITIE